MTFVPSGPSRPELVGDGTGLPNGVGSVSPIAGRSPRVRNDRPSPTLRAVSYGDGCLYAWDPELETFRRGCQGDTP